MSMSGRLNAAGCIGVSEAAGAVIDKQFIHMPIRHPIASTPVITTTAFVPLALPFTSPLKVANEERVLTLI